MSKSSFIFAVIFMILSLSSCAGLFRNSDDGENSFMEIGFREQKKAINIPEGTNVLKDITYGSSDQQKLDIYIPKKEWLQNKAPIIFMVHGGAWMVGDKKYHPVVANKIDRWLKKGIIFVSVNYRMSFSPDPLIQVEDVNNALKYIIANATKYGGDSDKIIVMGHSAGAHLVSLLTSNEKFSNEKWLGTISLDSAAFDLVDLMGQKHYRFYDRVFGKNKTTWIENSPTLQLTKKIKPMFIICSTKRSDSCPQANAFSKKAIELNSKITVYPIDLKHSEVNSNLGLESKYTTDVENFMKEVGITGL